MFFLAPLLFLAFVLWLERGVPRPLVLAVAAGRDSGGAPVRAAAREPPERLDLFGHVRADSVAAPLVARSPAVSPRRATCCSSAGSWPGSRSCFWPRRAWSDVRLPRGRRRLSRPLLVSGRRRRCATTRGTSRRPPARSAAGELDGQAIGPGANVASSSATTSDYLHRGHWALAERVLEPEPRDGLQPQHARAGRRYRDGGPGEARRAG